MEKIESLSDYCERTLYPWSKVEVKLEDKVVFLGESQNIDSYYQDFIIKNVDSNEQRYEITLFSENTEFYYKDSTGFHSVLHDEETNSLTLEKAMEICAEHKLNIQFEDDYSGKDMDYKKHFVTVSSNIFKSYKAGNIIDAVKLFCDEYQISTL